MHVPTYTLALCGNFALMSVDVCWCATPACVFSANWATFSAEPAFRHIAPLGFRKVDVPSGWKRCVAIFGWNRGK